MKQPVLAWLRRHDPSLIALRRGARAAVVMPLVFLAADRFVGDTTFVLFVAFGSLATLLLVSFNGSRRDHLIESGAMVVAELFLICLGTAVSRATWLAVAATAIVTFPIVSLSVIRPPLGKMTTSLIVSFLLPVTLPAPPHAIRERVLAWLGASLVSLLAIMFLWPVTDRDRTPGIAARETDSLRRGMQQAMRTTFGLVFAVLAAHLLSASHAIWVALGTLTVLCSSAIGTSKNVLLALAGTVIGIVFASGLIAVMGADTAASWMLLPFVILYTGFAPVGFSFLAGQVGFTTLLLLISNITAPTGWRVGLIRLEDISLGCAVSLIVGAMFWPRGQGQGKQQSKGRQQAMR